MAFSAAAFGVAAATAAGAILKFESENVLNDGPSALLNPNPTGAIPSIAQAIARQTCRRYADGVAGLDEGTAVDLETVCRPYLDNIGYGSGPEVELAFRGGQCAVTYEFRFQQRENDPAGGFRWRAPFSVFPIGPLNIGRVPNSGPDPAPAPGLFVNNAALFRGDGSVEITLALAQTDDPNGWRLVSLARIDGQPDSCGNPDPTFREPIPPVQPGPETEPFNPEPGIDIDIEVTLRPDSLIEVNFGLGPVIVPVFGGGGGDGGGGDGGPNAPGVPEAGPEVPGGNGGFGGDDGFGPPPAGRRWVGACLRVTALTNSQPPIPGSAPEDVYPTVIGNARLVYDAFGNRVVDTPVRIMAKGVCLWESVRGLNPVAVNVDLVPGWSYTYRPYSVPVEN